MAVLTLDKLKERLDYDPDTGIFMWLVQRGRVKIGAVAGYGDGDGYLQIKIDGKHCRAHRLAWLYMTGEWPKAGVDHVNGIRDDNRFCNLREATCAENLQNAGLLHRNTSGFIGVDLDQRRNKWRAKISADGRRKYLGYFTSPEAAYAAYLEAKAQLHTFQPTPRPRTDGGRQ